MATPTHHRHLPRRLTTPVMLLVLSVGVIALMLWLVGTFRPKPDAARGKGAGPRPVGDAKVIEVEAVTLPCEETAVGTMQPVHGAEDARAGR